MFVGVQDSQTMSLEGVGGDRSLPKYMHDPWLEPKPRARHSIQVFYVGDRDLMT